MEGSMRVFGLLFIVIFSLPVLSSTTFTTKINDIDYGEKMGDEILIFLENGRVAKLKEWDQNLLDGFVNAKSNDSWFSITLNDERYVTDLKPAVVQEEAPAAIDYVSQNEKFQTYVPTTVASLGVLQKYHREGRRTYKEETQCFNRAHVWTYEWWKRHSLKSMKIIIFFTRNYIRRYNFEWWWHIAPYAHVMENGKVVERVLDVKYTSGPREFQKWANIFLRNDAPCRVITKYSDYADNPYVGECYFYRANMYTYQAADLQMEEAWGYKKDKFIIEELRGAYKEAFDMDI
jgi:hypothetical protein